MPIRTKVKSRSLDFGMLNVRLLIEVDKIIRSQIEYKGDISRLVTEALRRDGPSAPQAPLETAGPFGQAVPGRWTALGPPGQRAPRSRVTPERTTEPGGEAGPAQAQACEG